MCRTLLRLRNRVATLQAIGSDFFNFEAFYAALDAVRRSRRLTWRQVARGTGISASTLTRMAQGSRPDIDTVVSLATWAALDPISFFPRPIEENPISMATSFIYRDPHLTPEAAAALEHVLRATYAQLAGPTATNDRGDE